MPAPDSNHEGTQVEHQGQSQLCIVKLPVIGNDCNPVFVYEIPQKGQTEQNDGYSQSYSEPAAPKAAFYESAYLGAECAHCVTPASSLVAKMVIAVVLLKWPSKVK